MAWRQITRYAFVWTQSANRFEVSLWLNPGGQNPNIPDHKLANLAPDQFEALRTLLRDDVDGKIFCDTQTGQISSGIDQIA